MLTVSDAFNTAAKATTRRAYARVEVSWADSYIDPDTVVQTPVDNNRTSWPQQIANGTEVPTHKWAILDGSWDLGGDYHLAPGNATDAADNEMGWWGGTLGDAGGEYTIDPEVEVTHAARTANKVLVVGDAQYGEYPVDFTVKFYNETGLAKTVAVTGNAVLKYEADLDVEVLNCTSAVLTIHKWSQPLTVIKILEFYTSVGAVYEGDDISSLNLLEELEYNDGTLPIGNVSSNELDLALNNILLSDGTKDPFYHANSLSPYATQIKPGRRVRAFLGFQKADTTIEYVPLGTFFSGDWQSAELSGLVTTTCRDRLDLLRKALYTDSAVLTNTTLFDLAETVLDYGRINIPMADLKWRIGEELKLYTIPYAWFGEVSYFDAVRQIASAARAQAYMDRNDVLVIGWPKYITGVGSAFEMPSEMLEIPSELLEL